MAETKTCPNCSTELPYNAPAGLCPACLMKAALANEGCTGSNPQLPQTTLASGFVPPTPEELAKHFSQIEILQLLGWGGMGAVYKARHRGLDRLVAIKILPPEIGHDPAFADRFTREARALARLNHSQIVSVYDFGQADAFFFIVMEYVDGVNLRQTIQSGRLTPQDALAIVPQICEALQYAHDEGIVHRDIKPENILIDRKGRVKIADFGLAKLLGREAADHSLTGTHQVTGTLRYMAPEQMEASRDIDHRADIYSLGVVFYEMLTGELPLGRFAPPSEKVQVDVRLDEVVLRSLAKEPERRYQQASEVKTEVEQIAKSGVLDSPPRQSNVVASSWASRLTWVASILVCLVGMVSSISVPWLEVFDADGGGHLQWYILDLKEAMLAAFGFLACGVTLVVLPDRGQALLWRAACQIGSALLIMTAIVVFLTESRAEFITPEGTRASNFAITEHGEEYDMRNSRTPELVGPVGPHFTLGWGVVLLLLGAWQLRTALSQRGEPSSGRITDPNRPTTNRNGAKSGETPGAMSDFRAINESSVQNTPTVLKKLADIAWLCAALSLIIGIGLLVYLGIVRGGGIPSERQVEFSVFTAAHLIYGSLFFIAGAFLRGLRGRLFLLISLVTVGICAPIVLTANIFTQWQHWAILLPFGFGIPLSFWTVQVLFRDEVCAAFTEQKRSARELRGAIPPERRVKAPAVGLLVTGLYAIVQGVLLLILVVLFSDGHQFSHFELVLYSIFGGALLIAGSVVCYGGWQMFHVRRFGWAVVAAILGQPLGIWSLLVLFRDDVRKAFMVAKAKSSCK